ncbi:hypothetical protein Tco_0066892 [Tanacetum coccineum]
MNLGKSMRISLSTAVRAGMIQKTLSNRSRSSFLKPHPQNPDEPPRQSSFTFRERVRQNPQPQALGTNFEARVRDYMAAHTERTEREEEEKSAEDNAMSSNSIVKHDGSDAVVPLKKFEKGNEAENGTKNEPVENAKKKLTRIKEEESLNH